MRNVAIIPARSGSKRVKNKNIRILSGKPLISWTIESTINSGLFEKIIVSTDSEEIANVALKYGVKIDELRPDSLSVDTTSASDVLKYHLLKSDFDNGCLLQPTSPLRSVADLCGSFELFVEKNANAVLSLAPLTHPLMWAYSEGECFGGFLETVGEKRSQDYGQSYQLNGAIYWFNVEAFKKFGTHLIPENSFPYFMALERSIDIDVELDFKIAEFLMALVKGDN